MGNPFSAVINGVEHVVDDMEHLVGKAVGELESLGIAAFGGMGAFIHFLVSLGEDPVHVISSLVSHISRFGGDVVQVLEETAHGVMTYGVTKFFEMKATQALAPIKDALNQQTIRGSQVAAVHQTTLTTMRTKLDALTTGNTTSGMAWQGASVAEMNASFADISQFIDELNEQLQHDSRQATLNHRFLQILEGIGVIAIGLVVLDVLLLIASCITIAAVTVGTAGVGDVVAVPLITVAWGSLLTAEVEFLLALVAADALIWLIGTIAIYVINHTTSTSNSGSQGGTIAQAHVNDLPTDITTAKPGGRVYIPPKKGHGKPFRSPDVKGAWEDAKGNDWEWAQDQHGGPHWDVQHPDGSHTNVAPDGTVIGKDNFPNNDSLVPESGGGD
jgi:hypothetical protein